MILLGGSIKRIFLFVFVVLVAVLVLKTTYFVLASDQPVTNSQKIYPYLINITDPDGQSSSFSGSSSAIKPEEIAKDLGNVIYPEDNVAVFPGNQFQMGGKISVIRAPQVYVTDWGKETLYRSFALTVESFLNEKSIELGQDDKVNFSLSTQIAESISIKITRVAVTNVVENKPIAYKTVTKNDPNLDEGKTRIDKAGVNGNTKLTYRVTRENGVQVSKVLIDTQKTADSVDQIQYKGTRPVITVPCRYKPIVITAAINSGYSANKICNLMMNESQGNNLSMGEHNGTQYYGLFQYTIGDDGNGGSWADMSKRAGYGGSRWTDPTAQIMTTVWALTNGYASKW